MAATVSIVNTSRLGDNFNVALVNFAWDATYPAGGEAFTANQVGMGTIAMVIPAGSPAGFTYDYDATNAKLKAFYADYSTTTDGVLIDVAVGDTAALTGVVTPLLVIGT